MNVVKAYRGEKPEDDWKDQNAANYFPDGHLGKVKYYGWRGSLGRDGSVSVRR